MAGLVPIRKACFCPFGTKPTALWLGSFISGSSADSEHHCERCLATTLHGTSRALKVPCASHTLNWENICPVKPRQQILALCRGIFKPRDGSPAQCGFCFLSPSSDEPDASSARLLFCHCQQATDVAQPCRKTPMEQDLTVLNIHRHLKLMGAPLVVRWGQKLCTRLGLCSARAAGAEVGMREV